MLSFPLIVKVNVTQRCNLSCAHCFLRDRGGDLPFSFLEDLAELFGKRRVAVACLTGGEPLLRADIGEIARSFSSKGVKVSLATNGTLLTREGAARLASCGVERFQVSLDGSESAIHDATRGPGTFELATRAVAAIVGLGLPATAAWTAHAGNHWEVGAMVGLAMRLGVEELRVQFYLPRVADGRDPMALDAQMIRGILNAAGSARPDGLTLHVPFQRTTGGCGAGAVSCVVNANRTISPCDLLAEHEQSRQLADAGDFATTWLEDPVFARWRADELSAPACARCGHQALCAGRCRAAAEAYRDERRVGETVCIARAYPE